MCLLAVWKRKSRPCGGRLFKLYQGRCDKPLRDLRHSRVRHSAVQSSRTNGRCLTCHRIFRANPRGVSAAQQSSNLKALSVLPYVLGLTYQVVSDVLDALVQAMSKSTAYNNAQEAGAESRLTLPGHRSRRRGGAHAHLAEPGWQHVHDVLHVAASPRLR